MNPANLLTWISLFFTVPLLVSAQALAGTGKTHSANGAPASSAPKAYCLPADAAAELAATSQAQPPAPVTGYPILIQAGHGDSGVLAAELYFGTVTAGRSRLAGYADVADQSTGTGAGANAAGAPGSSDGTIDLKSTAGSPFRFELTIGSTQDAQGAFDAVLLDADLFTGAPLGNTAYKCWFKRLN